MTTTVSNTTKAVKATNAANAKKRTALKRGSLRGKKPAAKAAKPDASKLAKAAKPAGAKTPKQRAHAFRIENTAKQIYSSPHKRGHGITVNGDCAKQRTFPSSRDAVLLAALKSTYANKPFSLAELDRDVINQAARVGDIDLDTTAGTGHFTKRGMESLYKLADGWTFKAVAV